MWKSEAIGSALDAAPMLLAGNRSTMIVLSAMCPWIAIDDGTWSDLAGLATNLDQIGEIGFALVNGYIRWWWRVLDSNQ
jgi:hypothetical protein